MDEYLSCLEALTREYDCISLYDAEKDELKLLRVDGLLCQVLKDLPDARLCTMVRRLSEMILGETWAETACKMLDRETILATVTEDNPIFRGSFPSGDEWNPVQLKILRLASGRYSIAMEYKQYVTEEIKEYLMTDCLSNSGMVILE